MKVKVNNLEETKKLAHALGRVVQPGDVVLLEGDLGVGKSEFVRFIVKNLCQEVEHVPSPTFTIVQTYDSEAVGDINHFDLYRIEHEEELVEIGIEDIFLHGVSFIEWPDRLGYLRPENCLIVSINRGCLENEREFEFEATTESWRRRICQIFDELGVG